jgi:hypothetical protein
MWPRRARIERIKSLIDIPTSFSSLSSDLESGVEFVAVGLANASAQPAGVRFHGLAAAVILLGWYPWNVLLLALLQLTKRARGICRIWLRV